MLHENQPDYVEGQMLIGSPNDAHTASVLAQSTLDALSAHIAILDHTGTIIAVNRAWREFADSNHLRDPDHAIGTNYLAICDATPNSTVFGVQEVAHGIRTVLSGERETFEWEYPCHSPTEQRWFSVCVTRFLDADPVRVVVAHENITQRKRAEQTRDAAEAYYRTLFTAAADAVFVVSDSGHCVDANAAAEHLTGYTVDELRHLRLDDLLQPADRRLQADLLQRVGDGVWRRSVELRRADGQCVAIEAAATQIDVPTGVAVIWILRDVSERRRREQEKQEFLRMVAHDLRTPLTSIRGFAQLLRRRQAYSQRSTDSIIVQADRMERLLTHLLDAERLAAGQVPVQPESVDLDEVVRHIIDLTQSLNDQHTFRVESATEPVIGAWDREHLERVVENLVSNAAKYSPHGGDIMVRLRHTDAGAQVDVSDQGIGIPQDALARIFDRFTRIDSTGGDWASGVGLGLYITRALVEAMGGMITVTSREGEGSTFTVTLPLQSVDSGR